MVGVVVNTSPLFRPGTLRRTGRVPEEAVATLAEVEERHIGMEPEVAAVLALSLAGKATAFQDDSFVFLQPGVIPRPAWFCVDLLEVMSTRLALWFGGSHRPGGTG